MIMSEIIRSFELNVLDWEESASVVCPLGCEHGFMEWGYQLTFSIGTVGELIDEIEQHVRTVHPKEVSDDDVSLPSMGTIVGRGHLRAAMSVSDDDC